MMYELFPSVPAPSRSPGAREALPWDGGHPLRLALSFAPGGGGPLAGDGGGPLAQGMGPLRVAPCPKGWPGDARLLPRGMRSR